jgi:hypothetical protein
MRGWDQVGPETVDVVRNAAHLKATLAPAGENRAGTKTMFGKQIQLVAAEQHGRSVPYHPRTIDRLFDVFDQVGGIKFVERPRYKSDSSESGRVQEEQGL